MAECRRWAPIGSGLYHEVGMAFGIKSPAANVAIGVAATLLSLYLIEAPSRRFGASLVRVWTSTPA